MPTEEDAGFTFVDKRHTSAAGPDSAEAAAPESSSTKQEPSGSAQTGATGPLHKLTVRDRILMCLDILNQGAWIAMGALEDPATLERSTDFAAAKRAIDGVSALADLVRPELDPATQRELEALVSELKLEFVRRKSLSTS